MKKYLPLILLVILSMRAVAAEPQWSRFRGPNGAGISDAAAIPVKWADEDYNWTAKLPGKGYSSPVVWGSKIFLTSTDKKATRIIQCLSTTDGRTLWRKDYKSKTHKMHRDNSYAAATPTVDAERVYVTWSTPKEVTLLALDHAGKEVWRRDLGGYVGLHGTATSPVVVGDTVVLGNDQDNMKWYHAFFKNDRKGVSFLIAVDRKTGKTRWKAPRITSLAAYGTPCVRKGDNGLSELIFASTSHGVTAVDAASGKVNWEVPKVFLDRCAGSPIVAGGLVIASYGRGNFGSLLVAVRPQKGAARAKVVWSMKGRQVPLVPTPLAIDGRLFCWAGQGTVTCLDAATGKQIWQERVGSSFYSSPVCVNGRLYCASKKGVMYVIAADDKFKLLAKVNLGEQCYATPAVADGVMYIRTNTKLMSLGGKKK
ncbi:MAG: PQQ-binding-like beta-propeller repeat protein [Phycisphaerae bacterium]|nr:PQQ-binding-like beta-propeller repeat protein [Phycisphaerae bacterium]